MDIDKYFKIKKWHDSSIGQLPVIQRLDKKRPKLSNLNQTQNRKGMLTLKMDPTSFVALTSIIQRRLFVLPSE